MTVEYHDGKSRLRAVFRVPFPTPTGFTTASFLADAARAMRDEIPTGMHWPFDWDTPLYVGRDSPTYDITELTVVIPAQGESIPACSCGECVVEPIFRRRVLGLGWDCERCRMNHAPGRACCPRALAVAAILALSTEKWERPIPRDESAQVARELARGLEDRLQALVRLADPPPPFVAVWHGPLRGDGFEIRAVFGASVEELEGKMIALLATHKGAATIVRRDGRWLGPAPYEFHAIGAEPAPNVDRPLPLRVF